MKTFFVRYRNFDLRTDFASVSEAEKWALNNYKGRQNGWEVLPARLRGRFLGREGTNPTRVRATKMFFEKNPRAKRGVQFGTLLGRSRSGLSWRIRWDGYATNQLCPKTFFKIIKDETGDAKN